MAGRVFHEVDGLVSRVLIDNPERKNAFSLMMEKQLRAAFQEAAAHPDTRVILLTGTGSAFSVGADMEQMGEDNDAATVPVPVPPASAALEENYARRFSYILALPKPVIAGMNGAAAGVGGFLPLYCDLRYMAADAKFALPFAKLGLIAEQGQAWLLPRLIGPMNALDLLLTARTITGAEAAALGLVRALPAENFAEEIRKIAATMAATVSPRSTAVIRRQIYDGLDQSFAESYYQGELKELDAFACDDAREGLAALLERRPARFTGR